MRFTRWTSLVILFVMVFLLPVNAASPVRDACAVITLSLASQAAYEPPMSRWLDEAAAMVKLRLSKSPSGAVTASLDMGTERAFTLTLSPHEGGHVLTGTLHEGRVLVPPMTDWADALMGLAASIEKLPSTGRTLIHSGESLSLRLSRAAVHLRAWAATTRATAGRECQACGECTACQQCEFTEATAMIIAAFAERFDTVPSENILLIHIEPVQLTPVVPAPPTPSPTPSAEPSQPSPAPDTLNVSMLELAVKKTALAIAENDVSAQ